jgi:hypothetical protein
MSLPASGLVLCATLSLTLSLTGCIYPPHGNVSPSVLSAWTFHPPQGWIAGAPNLGPLVAPTWSPQREWHTLTPPQLMSLTVMRARRPLRETADPFFTSASTVTVCHGIRALLLQSRQPFGMSISDEIEIREDGMAATATYFYPRGVAPDPRAETLLRTLCPRKAGKD